ncbi:MAG: hypothetical protein CL678_10685 [Bdellovibrionaceae bacterium]|nr:hypothetical protein [Pseudobdellovibrionaceae bacterium]|tara:strand:+ start:1336 stop:1896 length:561 start_codon:yes stop_codon:yes gene_type:complete
MKVIFLLFSLVSFFANAGTSLEGELIRIENQILEDLSSVQEDLEKIENKLFELRAELEAAGRTNAMIMQSRIASPAASQLGFSLQRDLLDQIYSLEAALEKEIASLTRAEDLSAAIDYIADVAILNAFSLNTFSEVQFFRDHPGDCFYDLELLESYLAQMHKPALEPLDQVRALVYTLKTEASSWR